MMPAGQIQFLAVPGPLVLLVSRSVQKLVQRERRVRAVWQVVEFPQAVRGATQEETGAAVKTRAIPEVAEVARRVRWVPEELVELQILRQRVVVVVVLVVPLLQ